MKGNINILLEKYFDGQTSLREEKMLKEYFRSPDVAAEHEMYKPFFEALQAESNVTMDEPVKPAYNITRKRSLKMISASVAAAAAVFLALLLLPASHNLTDDDTYAYINGTKITEMEFIHGYASTKLEKSFNIINNSLVPLQNIQTLKKGIDSGVNSMQNVRETIEGVSNKLKILNHEKDINNGHMPHSDGTDS